MTFDEMKNRVHQGNLSKDDWIKLYTEAIKQKGCMEFWNTPEGHIIARMYNAYMHI